MHFLCKIGQLRESQNEANEYLAKNFRQIPAQAFYTVIPQLVSRIVHSDKDTATIVRGILKRVLSKYPTQAMWPLAWLRNAKAPERKKIGETIFHEAESMLMKGPNQTHYKVLVASKSLFDFFHDLAKYTPKDTKSSTATIRPWKGEVDLSEFLPPVQAALSISADSTEGGYPRDPFPRQVPRMRCIVQKISLMTSKARPKKLKAIAITADSRLPSLKPREEQQSDLGEIHFLVKQEARGDLRKDARVQDLNNVINRLMVTSNDSKGGSRNRRRLHLRTFTVTCLSEDTGLLEWVPNTASLRSLVSKAYNPQAYPYSPRRRGSRLASFVDPTLRSNFETKCQAMYFNNGNLRSAAALFEELCLKPYPPLLYWWFVQKYLDPHSWYEARMRFTLSAAAWSAVGHVIGLGDRHSENILVDTSTGDCVHVDFDWYVSDRPIHRVLRKPYHFRFLPLLLQYF
jgi:serine/threonine-protein kinase ATR